MLVKCICTNCAGHLEFEEGNIGTVIPCPHCGFKTTLALPGTEGSEAAPKAPSGRRALLWWLTLSGVLALALGGLGFTLYRWVVPWLQDTFSSITSPVAAWCIAILACLAAPFLLFWLVFPVVVFLELHYLNASVKQLVEAVGTGGSEPAEEAEEEGSLEEEPQPAPEPEPVAETEEESSSKN